MGNIRIWQKAKKKKSERKWVCVTALQGICWNMECEWPASHSWSVRMACSRSWTSRHLCYWIPGTGPQQGGIPFQWHTPWGGVAVSYQLSVVLKLTLHYIWYQCHRDLCVRIPFYLHLPWCTWDITETRLLIPYFKSFPENRLFVCKLNFLCFWFGLSHAEQCVTYFALAQIKHCINFCTILVHWGILLLIPAVIIFLCSI